MLKKIKKNRKRRLLALSLSTGILISGAGLDFIGNPVVQAETKAETSSTAVGTPKLVDAASIDAVIQAMTLEEKSKFVVGVGMPGWNVPKLKVAGAVGGTIAIPRLGIPEMFFADGPAGVRINPKREGESRTYYATAFPIASAQAATWDTEMVEKIGIAQGNEIKEYGLDFLLAPALNIHRNPLNGRNFEYYSEDPLVAGKMTAAMVNGVQSNGVGATIKHFAANNQETNRFTIDTIVSERAMREIYLKGFETAIKESKPWAVMSSYNLINGTPASQNSELLTSVLRDDWDYGGFVMTDWFAGTSPVEQMKAGNDLIMPGDSGKSAAIKKAVEEGSLDEKVLDRNIKNILKMVVETPAFKDYQNSDDPDLASHAQVARQSAAEGMVLLKNEKSTLPINKSSKIGVFGNTQIETIKGGTGSGDVNTAYTISIADGLQDAGYQLDDDLLNRYKTYIDTLRQQEEYKIKPNSWGEDFGKEIPLIPEKPLAAQEISQTAAETDMGVIVIGRNSGEGVDRKNVKGDYLLTDAEQEMIATISKQYHQAGKKVAVVLNIGGPVEMASWRGKVDSILLAWQPGQEAGYAVADVLSGKVNPSGKLPTTFPVQYSDVRSAANFPGTPAENPAKVIYEEDIYVGYRYYSTFNVKPAYEFGYGLSYTQFDYSDVKLTNSGKFKHKIQLSVNIENKGETAGKEAVQIYVTAPNGKLEKPELELKAFKKTGVLKPGKKENLKFELVAKDLASFDENGNVWIVEKGTYQIKVGASSQDIRTTATFKVDKDIIVEEVSNSLVPKVDIDTLSR